LRLCISDGGWCNWNWKYKNFIYLVINVFIY
jgi:hypothetical protein